MTPANSSKFEVRSASSTMQLECALLLYAGNGASFATVHDVAVDKHGGAMMLPGIPATQESLSNLGKYLHGIGDEGFIPENVLVRDVGTLVWWCKPQSRQVWFKTQGKDDAIGACTAKAMHPGLVFAVRHGKWYVFAVKGEARPTPEIELFQAPYFNVWESGQICVGNVAAPTGTTVQMIEQWENAFFRSYFTHPNVPDAKLSSYRGGSAALWKALLGGKHASRFPEKYLVSRKIALADLIAALNQAEE